MDYSWKELNQLERILTAEAVGEPIDRRHAHHLASRLAELCPAIRHTMQRVQERMAG